MKYQLKEVKVIKTVNQIDCMITLLQSVKEELKFAEKYKRMENQEIDRFEFKRFPSGTFMRESLKAVSRLARRTADQIVLTPYCKEIEI